MKAYLLFILLICTTIQAQINISQSSGTQLEKIKSNLNDLKDKNGNSIFDFNESGYIGFEGETPGDYYGFSVSSAGDVNGDGYLDMIVGASNYNFSDTGKAYIYYGSALMDNIADVTMFGEGVVSSAEDVNGDGYSDVIAGPNLYFGGSPMDTVADVIFPNNTTSAGDINGDGYSDIIVGANLYFGGTSMDIIADVIFPNTGGPHYGGDVNGDGYWDVFVGANLYFGGSAIDTIADVIITESGWSLSSAGDVNGDEYSDIILGISGGAYIYFGGSSMNNVPDVTIINGYIGYSVSSAGDINGDGYSDVIIGDPFYDQYRGRVDIYYGGAIMNGVADITYIGSYSVYGYSTQFGTCVSSFSDGSGVMIGQIGGGPFPISGYVYLYRFYSTEPVLINPANNSAINPLTINFKWNKFNSAEYYVLEISTNSLFSNIIVTDTIYTDTAKIVSGFQKETKYFWRVRAKDTSGVMINSLISNFTTIPPITANLKLLFEGMYSPIYNQLSRKDSITIYLRDATPPFAIMDSAKNYIDTISFSNIFKFNNAIAGTYYIVVKHLNCLETWSKSGGENIIYDTSYYNYDFTTANSKAYGNNLKLKGSKYCLYSGDVNKDGFITLFDVIPIYNDAINFVTGRYIITDLTGDNIVDLSDVTLCFNNSSNFVRIRRP